MFVVGQPYLMTVSHPLGLIMINYLLSEKNEQAIKKALLEQVNMYKVENFVIRTFRCDGEGVLMKMKTHLAELRVGFDAS